MSNETLIRCCAPTMARLKTGNMFNYCFESREQMTEELRQLNEKLHGKGLRIVPLRWADGKALLYLYRPERLQRDLLNPMSRALLSECGYASCDAGACLSTLMARMRRSAPSRLSRCRPRLTTRHSGEKASSPRCPSISAWRPPQRVRQPALSSPGRSSLSAKASASSLLAFKRSTSFPVLSLCRGS